MTARAVTKKKTSRSFSIETLLVPCSSVNTVTPKCVDGCETGYLLNSPMDGMDADYNNEGTIEYYI